MKISPTLIAASAAGIVVAYAATATAETAAEFYKKHNITFHIGFGVGGGYDTYARVLGRHMGKHMPGNPTFTPQNRPGAGSMRMANELYNTLPRDGSAIGTISRGIPMEALFGNKRARFDPTKFNWIGSINNEVSICATWHATGITDLTSFVKNGTVVGGTGPGSDPTIFPKVLNNVAGGNLKLIVGYPSGTAVNVAMERGEVQARCGWSWSSVKSTSAQWLKEKKINLVLQMSTSKHPELEKMGVPWVMELADTPRERKILTLIFARQAMGRPILAPPGVPEDRVQVLREAFDAAMKDPAFIKEIEAQKLELSPVSGQEVQALITDMMSTPPDIVQAAKEATQKTGGMFIKTVKVQLVTHTGPVTETKKKGRLITIDHKGKKASAKISGSRTAVTIDGKKAKRGAVTVGMTCTFTYPGAGQEAKKLDCKS